MPAVRSHILGATLLASITLLGTFVEAASAAGVSVAPNRIVLQGRTLAATVYLSNRSDKPSTYRIGLARLRMLPSGDIVRDDDDRDTGELYADQIIRYSPRRAVIPPGGSQTVRLLVRRPRGDMPQNAEYRAHLSVRSIPDVPRLEELQESEPAPLGDDEISVRAVATVETLVPIIVRFGRLEAEAEIRDLSVALGPAPEAHLALVRSGARSLYGELAVRHVALDGETTDLGMIRGLAVYTPITGREIDCSLEIPAGVDLTSGTLVAEFHETPDGGGDQTASAEIPLGRTGTD